MIWVSLQNVERRTNVRLMNTNDVDDLHHEITRAFSNELAGFGAATKLVMMNPCPWALTPNV